MEVDDVYGSDVAGTRHSVAQSSLLEHQGRFLTELESHALFDTMVADGDALEACRLVLAASRQYGPQWIESHLEPPENTAQEVLPFPAV